MQRAKLVVECWKEINCCYCGCIYRRRVSSTKHGKAETQAEAEAKATQAAIDYLEQRIDVWPCPHCGNQQPEMVGSLRFTWHVVVLLASFAWIGPMLLEYHGLTPRWVAVLLLILLACVVMVLQLWVSTRFPNYYAFRNKIQATNLIRMHLIWISQGGSRKEGDLQWPDSIRPDKMFWSLLVASMLCWPLFGACDALRWTQGWPSNPTWHPEVIGPGDSGWVFLPTSIQCLKGHWTGQANAMLEDLAAPGVLTPIHASTRVDEWGHTIQVDRNESNSTRQLWVRIHLPDDEKWADKKVRVHLSMIAAFPVMDWNQREFRVQQQAAQHQQEIQLAPSGAGTKFWLTWYASSLLPFLVLLGMQLYSAGRAYQLKHSTRSGRVYPVKETIPDLASDEDIDVPPPSKDDTSFREERYPRGD